MSTGGGPRADRRRDRRGRRPIQVVKHRSAAPSGRSRQCALRIGNDPATDNRCRFRVHARSSAVPFDEPHCGRAPGSSNLPGLGARRAPDRWTGEPQSGQRSTQREVDVVAVKPVAGGGIPPHRHSDLARHCEKHSVQHAHPRGKRRHLAVDRDVVSGLLRIDDATVKMGPSRERHSGTRGAAGTCDTEELACGQTQPQATREIGGQDRDVVVGEDRRRTCASAQPRVQPRRATSRPGYV